MQMGRVALWGIMFLLVTSMLLAQPTATVLRGKIGSTAEWGSGWLDLPSPLDFRKGAKLRLTLGGSATKVVVRLLPRESSADSMDGVIPTVISVPRNRVVEVTVPVDAPRVKQISVHGGLNPWGQFRLGRENGPATLLEAECKKGCDLSVGGGVGSGVGGAEEMPTTEFVPAKIAKGLRINKLCNLTYHEVAQSSSSLHEKPRG